MQNISQRMETLEQQVQFFMESVNNQTSTSTASGMDSSSPPVSSSAYLGGEQVYLRGLDQHGSEAVPPLNTPESDGK